VWATTALADAVLADDSADAVHLVTGLPRHANRTVAALVVMAVPNVTTRA
jgi:hypothetical protein